MKDEPMVGLLTWREECKPLTATMWHIPAYGFLAGVELALMEPLPNMNTAAPMRLVASLEVDGQTVEIGEALPELKESSKVLVRAELRDASGAPIRFGACIAKMHRVASPV